jgi:SAM-dependent methyltransferase
MAPHRAILRAAECRLMSRVELRPPVLDVGCGDGHFASICYSTPIDVGVDVHLGDAREAAARLGAYRSVVLAGGTEMPFRDSSFGTVVSNCVLEHIPDIDGALAEIARVLRPGGELAITVPNPGFPEQLFFSRAFARLGAPSLAEAYGRFFNRISHHCHMDNFHAWEGRLDRAGLRVVEHRAYFSAAAVRAFDLSLYAGVPNLATRMLTGRWVLHPAQMALAYLWLRRYSDEPDGEFGACDFIRARKPEV